MARPKGYKLSEETRERIKKGILASGKAGRPKGTKQTESAKKKISQTLKDYYKNMSEDERQHIKDLNELRRYVWKFFKENQNNYKC